MSEPIVRPTRYEVSCLPPDIPDADVFTITVQWRGQDRWAVVRSGGCYLGEDGTWSWGYRWPAEGPEREPVTDEEFAAHATGYVAWLNSHRFSRHDALELAKKHAPLMIVNGWTVDQVLAQEATHA